MTAFLAFFIVLLSGIAVSVVFGILAGILVAIAVSSACIIRAINSLKNDDLE